MITVSFARDVIILFVKFFFLLKIFLLNIFYYKFRNEKLYSSFFSIFTAVTKESVEYLRHQLSVKSFAAAGLLEDLLFENSRTLATYKLQPNDSLRNDDI